MARAGRRVDRLVEHLSAEVDYRGVLVGGRTAAGVCRWMARTWSSCWPWRRAGPPDERLEAANPGKGYLTRHPGKGLTVALVKHILMRTMC